MKSTDEVHVLGKVQSGSLEMFLHPDIGTQDVIEYIRRVSDIKNEWSTPGEKESGVGGVGYIYREVKWSIKRTCRVIKNNRYQAHLNIEIA